MTDQLHSIDVETIDQLATLKTAREVLAQRLARLESERDKVSPEVYQRVRADYGDQRADLDAQAAPLKERARQEFARLLELLRKAQAARRETELQREELELRHRIGEYDDTTFDSRREQLDALFAERNSEVETIEQVRERFVAAVDSESELAAASEPEADAEASSGAEDGAGAGADSAADEPGPPAVDVPAAPSIDLPSAAALAAPSEPEPAEPPAGREGDDAEETSPAPEQPAAEVPPSPAPEAPPEPAPAAGTPATPAGHPLSQSSTLMMSRSPVLDEPEDTGATGLVRVARLVPVEPGPGAAEFIITDPVTTIGRTRQSMLQVDEPAVSRKHAELHMDEDGYLLRDLGSENGTYVNGQRIVEHRLVEADHIQVGTIGFVFRISAPEPAG